MTATLLGPTKWEGSADDEGNRTWLVTYKVSTSTPLDGPNIVRSVTGLPSVGSAWSINNDADATAFRTPFFKVRTAINRDEPETIWLIDLKFTTSPGKRCQDTEVGNPLSEPDRIGGGFVRYEKELAVDKDGNAILNSVYEPITGIMIRDDHPTIWIEQNVASLQLSTMSSMVGGVNQAPMWGLGARTAMLVNASFEKKYYGSCNAYYTRRLEFEIDEDGWDLDDVVDAGFKHVSPEAVAGGGPITEESIIAIKDSRGENTPRPVLLDGSGSILDDPAMPVFIPTVQFAADQNFFLLGIPASF